MCAICERTITTRPVALGKTTAALFEYHHPLIKKAIWALKYHRRRSLAEYFGTALYREFFTDLARKQKHGKMEDIVLVPVPGNKKAISMRGYNHAALIAHAIARAGRADGLDMKVLDRVLYKKHEVTPQARTKGKRGRAHNVAGLFGIKDAEALFGKTVILIDDVITTGATVTEAKRAVKTALPKRVLTLAVAH